MADTAHKLLEPRWELINDWPSMPFGFYVGMKLTETDALLVHFNFDAETMNKFKHLFKPLAWWEKREESEMPEWVKNDKEVFKNYGMRYGHMIKVVEEFNFFLDARDLLPATQTEYLTFINKKKV